MYNNTREKHERSRAKRDEDAAGLRIGGVKKTLNTKNKGGNVFKRNCRAATVLAATTNRLIIYCVYNVERGNGDTSIPILRLFPTAANGLLTCTAAAVVTRVCVCARAKRRRLSNTAERVTRSRCAEGIT